MEAGVHVLCVHEFPSVVGPPRHACEFGTVMASTPGENNWPKNLYSEIALALKGAEWRTPGLVALASKIAASGGTTQTRHSAEGEQQKMRSLPIWMRRGATTKKKTTRRTTTTRRKTTRKAEVKPRTKSQIYSVIAEKTDLTKREVASVFDEMAVMIKKDLGRSGPGAFTVPGLMKIVKQHKPRRPARKGVNPFTGEEMMFKAKPAHNVVKVRPLKALKEMV